MTVATSVSVLFSPPPVLKWASHRLQAAASEAGTVSSVSKNTPGLPNGLEADLDPIAHGPLAETHDPSQRDRLLDCVLGN